MLEDHWAETDPVAAYAFAAAYPLGNESFLHKILRSWTKQDPKAAFLAATKIADTGKLGRKDEDYTFATSRTVELKALREEFKRPNFLKTVIEEFTLSRHPSEVQLYIEQLRDPVVKRKAVTALSEVWASKSWPEAKAWANGQTSQELRDAALGAASAERARLVPEEAEGLLEQMPEGMDNLFQKERIVEAWAQKSPVDAYTWIAENASGESAIQLMKAALKNGDPETASRFLVDNHTHGSASIFVDSVARWGETDPDAALAWAKSVDSSLRGPAIGATVEGWAGTDLAGAQAYAEALPASDPFRRQVVAGLARAQGELDPAGALTWLSENADAAGQAFGPISMELVNDLASENPSKAAALLESFPEPIPGQLRFREIAIDAMVRQWAQVDLEALNQWAQSLSSTEVQHAHMVYASLSSLEESLNPKAAEMWSEKITDLEYRKKRSFGL